MRLHRLSGLAVLLFFGGGLEGCFHSLQMDRKGGSSYSDDLGGGLSGGATGTNESGAVAVLERRLETKGEDPGEERVVSVLDSLNERFPYRSYEARGAQAGELAEVVVHLLRDPSEEVRFRAAELLGKIGTSTQENALIETSEKDPSPVVREMAAESLEHLGLGYEVWRE